MVVSGGDQYAYRGKKVEEVLQEALDRPAHERRPFLEQADLDEEQRNEAASLIAAHESAGDFIEEPALVRDAHVILDHRPTKNIGAEIGPYRIQQFLGAGGMGEVYLAEDNRLKRHVALKLLPAYFAADDERLARFKERRKRLGLNHPNILTIHEVASQQAFALSQLNLLMAKRSELISKGQLPLGEILDIATQVASGLAAAHAAGIVHRDIKPDNIMRRQDGLVKLLDFGVAKLLEPAQEPDGGSELMQTEMGTLVGTVNYMSPEQARGLAIDARTDIWVWRCALQMFTIACHHGATRMDTLVDILEHEPCSAAAGANVRRSCSPWCNSSRRRCERIGTSVTRPLLNLRMIETSATRVR